MFTPSREYTRDEKLWLVLTCANALYGTMYLWGGESPFGFDCSGWVQELLRVVGLDPPGDQGAQGLYRHFRDKQVDYLRAGCVTFYGSSVNDITHVAFALDDISIIEAGGGGSKTTNAEAAHRAKAFVRIRPFTDRTNCVAIVDPFL